MLIKKIPLGSNRGQSLVEFLPAILLFMVVIAASLVFFMGLRESFQMQEAARNAAFTKIANSGPMISNANRSSVKDQYEFPMSTGLRNVDVNQTTTCFAVTPNSGETQARLPSILGLNLNLSRAHKMSVFRRPGAPGACDN